MSQMSYRIKKILSGDKEEVKNFVTENWGSHLSVSKGKIHDTTKLDGFICRDNKEIIGLITYFINGQKCEIVTLDSKLNNIGLGSALIKKVINKAKNHNCSKVWLITTNDNINAIRFYQKRGFDWIGFYYNSMIKSRKLKPEIPLLGTDKIPIKHELEFELRL